MNIIVTKLQLVQGREKVGP